MERQFKQLSQLRRNLAIFFISLSPLCFSLFIYYFEVSCLSSKKYHIHHTKYKYWCLKYYVIKCQKNEFILSRLTFDKSCVTAATCNTFVIFMFQHMQSEGQSYFTRITNGITQVKLDLIGHC